MAPQLNLFIHNDWLLTWYNIANIFSSRYSRILFYPETQFRHILSLEKEITNRLGGTRRPPWQFFPRFYFFSPMFWFIASTASQTVTRNRCLGTGFLWWILLNSNVSCNLLCVIAHLHDTSGWKVSCGMVLEYRNIFCRHFIRYLLWKYSST